jgi:hypothetical protein
MRSNAALASALIAGFAAGLAVSAANGATGTIPKLPAARNPATNAMRRNFTPVPLSKFGTADRGRCRKPARAAMHF